MPQIPARKPPIAILAHGAGSSGEFLARAFPADRLGVADCIYLDDRTGDINRIQENLRSAVQDTDAPVLLGGVSLGAHAAAMVLSDPPSNVVGGLLILPAWSGANQPVADLTAIAAEAVRSLGSQGVLQELPTTDWVTEQLSLAWARRTDESLVNELATAAEQPGPTLAQLRTIPVPVGLVKLQQDPLHPATVAELWSREIPAASVTQLLRDEPAPDLAVFADAARAALRAGFAARQS
ncbi:alpha/beta hydrolase [Candidatus Nanopelagicales bacterium]|nr:alpha/beta hydrolase [Candidatus Nanopelagicales bacterium]